MRGYDLSLAGTNGYRQLAAATHGASLGKRRRILLDSDLGGIQDTPSDSNRIAIGALLGRALRQGNAVLSPVARSEPHSGRCFWMPICSVARRVFVAQPDRNRQMSSALIFDPLLARVAR